MKNITLIIITLIITNLNSIDAQDILWKKNFGLATADDFGRVVLETSDGSLLVAGHTGSYGEGGFDVWLIKTDADGNILWTKTYGGLGDDYGYSLKQTEDGGFIIGGATNSFGVGGLDYYLIKTDSLGDTLWTKTYGGFNDDYCLSLVIVNEGYVLAGKKNSNQPLKPDIWVLKTDQIGNLIWDKTYSTSGDDVAYSIEKTNDDGFIIAAEWSAVGMLMKLNQLGDSLWTKSFSAGLQAAVEIYSGGFLLTGAIWNGAEQVNVLLMKTDSLGNIEWERTYDYQNDYDIGYSVQQTSDGGFIVCGNAQVDGGSYFGWIIRTNSVGDTLWTKELHSYVTFSVQSSINTICYSVIQTLNGDYIVTGNQPILPVSDHAQQVVLLRIASDIVPVELTSFTATVTQNSVSLNWQTATETNNSGFEVQRIQNSKFKIQNDWEAIGLVAGHGTTTETQSYLFEDKNILSGKYQYRLKQIDFDGAFEYSNTVEVEITSPTEFSLEQNYPNPFNPSTVISYSLPQKEFVTIKVIDILGRDVATLVNEVKPAGKFEVEFSVTGGASSLASGVYVYQINAGSFTTSKKMLLTK